MIQKHALSVEEYDSERETYVEKGKYLHWTIGCEASNTEKENRINLFLYDKKRFKHQMIFDTTMCMPQSKELRICGRVQDGRLVRWTIRR